jgi:inorganic pyrophosphatase
MSTLPHDQPQLRVRIEVPRGAFVKRSADDARVELVSPLPCPFNYGSVLDTCGDDGDPWDAVVLGPPLARGAVVEHRVWGRVDFVDGGAHDPKWVLGARPPGRREWLRLRLFFSTYGLLKNVRDLITTGRFSSGSVRIHRQGATDTTESFR